jgi:hypothetical protein
VDQQVIRPFAAWQRFLLYNQRIAEAGLTLRKAFSLVLDHTSQEGGTRNVTAKGMQVDPECASQCDSNYWSCVDNGGCDYADCARCQSDYDQCIYLCPLVCVEPKSQTSSTTTQNWNGPTNTGNAGCYKSPWGANGYYYYQTVMERKHTTTTTTTHCNNTTSTSTSVWYSYQYCWNSTSITCGHQDLWSIGCY